MDPDFVSGSYKDDVEVTVGFDSYLTHSAAFKGEI